MLGLDISTLAVPDYEIIARIERLIATVNGTLLQAQQTVPINVLPVNAADYLYSSSSSILADPTSTSPTRRRHHHHHHRDRSPSPQKHHHHHSTASPRRNRSKSPRKVTIDPNSY